MNIPNVLIANLLSTYIEEYSFWIINWQLLGKNAILKSIIHYLCPSKIFKQKAWH